MGLEAAAGPCLDRVAARSLDEAGVATSCLGADRRRARAIANPRTWAAGTAVHAAADPMSGAEQGRKGSKTSVAAEGARRAPPVGWRSSRSSLTLGEAAACLTLVPWMVPATARAGGRRGAKEPREVPLAVQLGLARPNSDGEDLGHSTSPTHSEFARDPEVQGDL